ncbi:MAG: toll/interleukin-1 receptor domain-containing protein [Chloroflexi bacterium]|nr:toll/interleukin-1 receptor domain-containing protein [Chloroflexota bacterium]
MPRIFISYRRDDSQETAGRLHDALSRHFGDGQVFMDVVGIELGDDFVAVIERNVASCDVLLAVIGKQWLTIADSAGRRRLDNPRDFVRLEIATAIKRNVRVIPLLARGASMPPSSDLPRGLQTLSRRQALELRHNSWRRDVAHLIETIERLSGSAAVAAPARRRAQATEPGASEAAANLRRRTTSLSEPSTRVRQRKTSEPSRSRSLPKQVTSSGKPAVSGASPTSPTGPKRRASRPSAARVAPFAVRAAELVPTRGGYSLHGPQLCLVVAGMVTEPVLRPSELEDPALYNKLRREAIDSPAPVLSPEEGTRAERRADTLIVVQEGASVMVDEHGSVRVLTSIAADRHRVGTGIPAILEEDVQDAVVRALRFAGRALNLIDRRKSIEWVVLGVAVIDGGGRTWRTRAEHAASPNSGPMGWSSDRVVVQLNPPSTLRASLGREAKALATDFVTLLRRQLRGDHYGR